MNRYWTIAAALLLCAAGAQASGPSAANPSATNDNRADQRIYIDPETGERRAPTAEERARMRDQANRRAGQDGPRVIERPDGSTMIIHDPDDFPKYRSGPRQKTDSSPR